MKLTNMVPEPSPGIVAVRMKGGIFRIPLLNLKKKNPTSQQLDGLPFSRQLIFESCCLTTNY